MLAGAHTPGERESPPSEREAAPAFRLGRSCVWFLSTDAGRPMPFFFSSPVPNYPISRRERAVRELRVRPMLLRLLILALVPAGAQKLSVIVGSEQPVTVGFGTAIFGLQPWYVLASRKLSGLICLCCQGARSPRCAQLRWRWLLSQRSVTGRPGCARHARRMLVPAKSQERTAGRSVPSDCYGYRRRNGGEIPPPAHPL